MPRLQFSCPENITTHPKTKAGHFCTSCSKDVVDFRNFSAEEMRNYFLNHPEKSCGIFHPKQITDPVQTTLSSLFRFAFGLVFLLGMNSQTLFSQSHTDTLKTQTTTESKIKISGQVTDEYEALPFVRILIYQAGKLVVAGSTDIDGFYTIQLPDSIANAELEMIFRFIGYSEYRVKLNTHNLSVLTVNAHMASVPEQLTVGILIEDRPPIIPADPYDFNRNIIKGDDLKKRQR